MNPLSSASSEDDVTSDPPGAEREETTADLSAKSTSRDKNKKNKEYSQMETPNIMSISDMEDLSDEELPQKNLTDESVSTVSDHETSNQRLC